MLKHLTNPTPNYLEDRKPYIELYLNEDPKEQKKRKARMCAYCKYSSKIFGHTSSSSPDYVICDYLIKTGRSRGCSPIECKRFEKREGRR